MSNYRSKPDGMTEFETLIRSNRIKSSDRWAPSLVKKFMEKICAEGLSDMKQAEQKNIAYSLQYLQFLQFELEELKLHNVVEKHLWKTYIITAMSIIEVIFNHIVRKNNKQKQRLWEDIKFETNAITQNGKEKMCVVLVKEKLKVPVDEEMDFFTLIETIEKNRLIPFRTKGYKDLQKLRSIRNKVHLGANEMIESDYYSINKTYYLFARRYLYYILTNEKVCPSHSEVFDFLLLSEEDGAELEDYLSDMEEP